ncbi:hypothetical protein FRC08_001780 [Ceratobasidium sp. 394]|nr:hypothetical protein FRC08_001780 [Ceratobasidium sp. 394]KAG9089734.1 hypothetical protein FS749_001102 [Ceratobasidium sp. UAMH 11750]
MIPAPHLSVNWYPDSVSYTLQSLAAKGQGVLPQYLFLVLEEAAERVYIHESYVNELQVQTLPGFPIHHDSFFVYSGYKNALSNLIRAMSDPLNQADIFCTQVCTHLSAHLHQMLAILRARGMDHYRLYNSPDFLALLSNFEFVF